jgi:hypothetical protein
MAALSTTLGVAFIGCTEIDKPKDWKLGNNTKQPGPGLPGTPRLQGQPNSGVNQPGGNAVQPASAFGSTFNRNPSGTNLGAGNSVGGSSIGSNPYVPPVGPQGSANTNNYNYSSSTRGTSSSVPGGPSSPQYGDLSIVPPPPPGSSGSTVSPPGPMYPAQPNN